MAQNTFALANETFADNITREAPESICEERKPGNLFLAERAVPMAGRAVCAAWHCLRSLRVDAARGTLARGALQSALCPDFLRLALRAVRLRPFIFVSPVRCGPVAKAKGEGAWVH